jgi:hypothetical protein
MILPNLRIEATVESMRGNVLRDCTISAALSGVLTMYSCDQV